MVDLSKERVEGNVYLFQNTRVEYFVPFEVTVLRRPMKHWCCLFTCLVTRAVHMEVVNGLDTDVCMIAVTGFMARRGKPHTILSDHGTLLGLRENSEIASRNGIETLCVSKWHVKISHGSSILLELRILVEFGGDWFVAARKLCLRFSETVD